MGLTRSWQFHKAHHSTILQSNCCIYLYSTTKTITKTQPKLVCNSVLLCHHHQIMLQSSQILCLLPKTTTSGKNGHSVQLLREVTLPGLHTTTSWACCDEGKIFLSWERQNYRRSQTSATQDVSSKLIWLSSAIFCTNTPSVPGLRNVLPVNQIQ